MLQRIGIHQKRYKQRNSWPGSIPKRSERGCGNILWCRDLAPPKMCAPGLPRYAFAKALALGSVIILNLNMQKSPNGKK